MQTKITMTFEVRAGATFPDTAQVLDDLQAWIADHFAEQCKVEGFDGDERDLNAEEVEELVESASVSTETVR